MATDPSSRSGAILVGKSAQFEYLTLALGNRHGLIAGATGTGKTVTLQKLAEGFSAAGVPVFLADVKGDLAGMAAAGIEPEAAQKAIGLILNFLLKEGPAAEVNAVVDAVPGGREAVAGAAVEEDGNSILSGLTGGKGGGLMDLAGQLGGLGLSMGEMQTIGREILGYAREKVGEDTVGEIAGAIPGLHQLM